MKIKNKKDKSFQKKPKHEPSLKKPGDFTVPEGHGYPLVQTTFYIPHTYCYQHMSFPTTLQHKKNLTNHKLIY